jgi:hypothetical protein
MSRLGDYRCEMRTRRLLDREIEKLLTGAPVGDRNLALLTPMVEGSRSSAGHRPQESDVRIFAARAAAVVLERSHHLTDAAASRRRRAKGLTPRLAAATLAVLMVPAMAGAALAADSAIPGDPLYGIDRAFEVVGIGAGSAGERLTEAAQLADGGRSQEAIDHALLALETEGDTTNAAALQALEALAGRIAGVEQAEVVALLAYISENVGKGVGADGSEFGQGVADLARAIGGGGGPTDQPNDSQGNGPDQPGSSAPSPGGPPATNPGQGQGNGNDQGQGNGQGQGSGQGQGNGQANGSGSGGNPNGNGDPGPPDEPGNVPPGQASQGQPSTEVDPVAPESGGDDADEANQGNGNGNGPGSDSPSVTAPGREKKP